MPTPTMSCVKCFYGSPLTTHRISLHAFHPFIDSEEGCTRAHVLMYVAGHEETPAFCTSLFRPFANGLGHLKAAWPFNTLFIRVLF